MEDLFGDNGIFMGFFNGIFMGFLMGHDGILTTELFWITITILISQVPLGLFKTGQNPTGMAEIG